MITKTKHISDIAKELEIASIELQKALDINPMDYLRREDHDCKQEKCTVCPSHE